ncbi:MAG: isochorismatase family protein [Candidatus Yanofskybacteria bacterium]|nr:isochorismatase family protein [Candidatus Yanofskybacteria bacterium]
MNRLFERAALLVTDVQNDFCPGGTLGVENGDKIVESINRLTEFFEKIGRPIFYSKDWHPKVTRHFKEYNGSWPEHCVAGTQGAEFHPNLIIRKSGIIILKGESPDDNDYSPFKGRVWVHSDPNNVRFYVPFPLVAESLQLDTFFNCGLATDWCDKAGSLDGRALRYAVHMVLDACRPVNLNIPNDPWRKEPKIHNICKTLESQGIEVTDENIALEEMRRAGVIFTTTDEVLSQS